MLEYRHFAVAALTLALSSAVFPAQSPAQSSASASAESGAFSRFIDGIVSSKVSFDYSYVLDNGKAQARAADLPGTAGIHAVKTFE